MNSYVMMLMASMSNQGSSDKSEAYTQDDLMRSQETPQT